MLLSLALKMPGVGVAAQLALIITIIDCQQVATSRHLRVHHWTS